MINLLMEKYNLDVCQFHSTPVQSEAQAYQKALAQKICQGEKSLEGLLNKGFGREGVYGKTEGCYVLDQTVPFAVLTVKL